MTERNSATDFTPPSRRSILLSTTAALIIAGIVLVTIVLPAEFGIDPTGIGQRLGLTALSQVQAQPAGSPALLPAPAETNANTSAQTSPPTPDDYELLPQPPEEIPGLPVPAPLRNPAVMQQPGTKPREDTIDVALAVGEEVEMKAILAVHQALLFSWSVVNGEVYYDFHAEPANGPEGYFVRYAEGEGNNESGSLVAPFTGHHGWYWLNISEHPITVRLEVTGYHSDLVEVYRGRQGS